MALVLTFSPFDTFSFNFQKMLSKSSRIILTRVKIFIEHSFPSVNCRDIEMSVLSVKLLCQNYR